MKLALKMQESYFSNMSIAGSTSGTVATCPGDDKKTTFEEKITWQTTGAVKALDLAVKSGQSFCINAKIAQSTLSGFFHLVDGVASQRFEVTSDSMANIQTFARKNVNSGQYRFDPVDSKSTVN